MSDTLMTPADSSTDAGASGAAPAAAAPTAALTAKPGEGQAGALPAGQGAGEADAGDAGKSKDEGATGGETAGEAEAPIAYTDFAVPDGVELPADLLAAATTFAKEQKLPQDKAQELVNFTAQQVKANQDRVVAVRQQWVADAQADPEFGGDKLATSLPIAQRALKTFGSEALTELLNGTGLGNHPEVIRLLHKVGQAIGEDGVVTGGGEGARAAPKDTAKKLYPSMA